MGRIYLWGDPDRFCNYERALAAVGGTIQFGGDYQECSGLLLPGGGDLEPWRYGQENVASRGLEPERDQTELELLAWFVSRGRPVLGICRGLQTVNVFFGGTLVQDLPGHNAFGEQDRFHRVRTEASRLGEPFGEINLVNSAHHQAVDVLGEGLMAVQWTPDGVIEAVAHRQYPVWGVQWHPERMPPWLAGNVLGWFAEKTR